MDAGEEVARGLVVARGDGAELLELAEEVLDQMACLVEFGVERARIGSGALARDHRGLVGSAEPIDHPGVDVVRLVGDQRVGGELRQKCIGAEQVMCLPRSEQEADRVAERVDQGMDLGAQPAFAAADRLVFAIFLGAPALC